MAVTVQFSWLRLEGIGLIISAFGWALITQLPVLFWALALLYIDISNFLIAIIGITLGMGIILATLSCSLTEDWNTSIAPDFKRVITASLFYSFLFLLGFFLFFLFEPIFPSEFSNLGSAQRYFSAITVGLGLAGIVTVLIHKVKDFFR
ncbi:MAG: hypothetical protein ACFFAU_00700 [Candidatus Hodarchaeota archaeon]